jgi:hypothetical protein
MRKTAWPFTAEVGIHFFFGFLNLYFSILSVCANQQKLQLFILSYTFTIISLTLPFDTKMSNLELCAVLATGVWTQKYP